jgi:hypothetical protein
MADGQGDDDDDEGVPEEKRLADDVRADTKVERRDTLIRKCTGRCIDTQYVNLQISKPLW